MPEEEEMPRKPIALFGLVLLAACGGGGPAVGTSSQFAGAWTLVKIEQFDADGELLAPLLRTASATSSTTRPATWV